MTEPVPEKIQSPRIELNFQRVLQLLQTPPNDIPWHKLDQITDPKEREKKKPK